MLCRNGLFDVAVVASEARDAHSRLSIHAEDLFDKIYVLVTAKLRLVLKQRKGRETN